MSKTVNLIAGKIFSAESADEISFGNDFYEIFFSKINGQCTCIEDKLTQKIVAGSHSCCKPGFEITEGGTLGGPKPEKTPYYYVNGIVGQSTWGKDARYIGNSIVRTPLNVECHITFGDERWIVDQILTIVPRDPIIRIDIGITYLGEDETKLRKAVFSWPELPSWANTVNLPGRSILPELKLSDVPEDFCFDYAAYVHNMEKDYSIIVWGHDELFKLLNVINAKSGCVQVRNEHFAAGTFKRGCSLRYGRDYFSMCRGGFDKAVEIFRSHYPELGYDEELHICNWAKQAVIFEGFIGEILFEPEYRYAPYPTIADFKKDLPHIASLGFNTIQLMPKMPLPGYTVYNYQDIGGTHGGCSDKELKDFIQTAKSLRMKVIFDILMHGVSDAQCGRRGLERYTIRGKFFECWRDNESEVNPYRAEHPEWFRKGEDGDFHFLHTWNFDFEDDALSQMFTSHLIRCVKEFNVDGFRFDAPYWGRDANWSEDYPVWAGASATRTVKLLRNARKELRILDPEILWYSEEIQPEWRAFMDMTYTYDEIWLYHQTGRDGKPVICDGSINAKELAEWFYQRQTELPHEGATLQHHADSHDSWWHELESGFTRELYGRGPSEVMTAFNAFLDGAFLSFADAQKDNEDFLRKVLFLRNNIDAIKYGRCDFLNAYTDGEFVSALWREYKGKWVIPLFNFSSETVVCKVYSRKICGCANEIFTLYDIFGGGTIAEDIANDDLRNGISVTLGPYQTLLISK